jgi:hypothetical protein
LNRAVIVGPGQCGGTESVSDPAAIAQTYAVPGSRSAPRPPG